MQTYMSTSFLFSLCKILTGSKNYEFIIYIIYRGRFANMPLFEL